MTKIDEKAPFSYEGLDRVMHEKARLGVLTSLMAHPKGLAFADLKQLCGLTDGNLSRHLQVLQEAGLLEIIKGYENNRPHTKCRLTAARAPALPRLSGRARARRARCRRGRAPAGGTRGRPLPPSRLTLPVTPLLFCRGDFMMQSDLPSKLHVAIIMDGNGRWATAQGPAATGRTRSGRRGDPAGSSRRPRTSASARSRSTPSRPTTGAGPTGRCAR